MSNHYWLSEIVKEDFASFIGKAFTVVNPAHVYESNWHIDYIAEHLEAVRRGEIKRLIINVPPRSLKSICVSVAWPAWLLAHRPEARIIAASYGLPLAIKHSVDCRKVVQSDWYQALFPYTRISSDQNEKHKFATTRNGFRFASSINASLTGEGGDVLIVDDPLNAVDAYNKGEHEAAANWFDQSFSTRLDHKKHGAIVVVMQRLHEADLTGHLLAKGNWEHLCVPAEAKQEIVYSYGRVHKVLKAHEVFHPQRMNKETLEVIHQEMGSYAYAAQYQQDPAPEAGGMVKKWWFSRYQQLPEEFDFVVQSWDTAIKTGAQHDASVCITFGMLSSEVYIIDVMRDRLEYPDLRRCFGVQYRRYTPEAVLIEDKASGQQLIQDMRRESHIPVVAVQAKKDKVVRFAAACPMIEAGQLYLPKHASWLVDFEKELFGFPDGGHDDQVDALSQFLNWLRERRLKNLQLRRV